MKTPTTGGRTSFSYNSPAVKHYLWLSVLWILAGVTALLAIILFAALAAYGFKRYFYGLGVILAIDGAILAAVLLGIALFNRFRKPPALTIDDARTLGVRFVLYSGFITMITIGRALFPWHSNESWSGLLGSVVPLVVVWAAPAYWFWRAKRMRA